MYGRKRWGLLAMGSVMMVALGLIYAWSIFAAPIEAEYGWSRAQISMTFTICMTFFVIGLIVSGMLVKRLSARSILLAAAGCLLAGLGLCSRVTTVPGLYVSYGVLVGFAVGVAYNALVSTLVKWFPDRHGLASGVLMMGFGLGGMVLGSAAATLMLQIGWRSTFLLFGAVFAAVLALGSLTVVPPPGDAVSPVQGKAAAPQQNPDRSVGEMLRRPSLWIYAGWFTLTMAGGLIVIGHASLFAQSLGVAEQTAAVLAGLLSLCNGAGRILTGAVYDRFGLRTSMLLTTLYLLAAALLLLAGAYTGAIVPVVCGFVLAGLSYGGGPTTSSTFARGFYGMKHFAVNYGVISAGLIPGALLGPYLAGVLFTASGAYLTSFAAMLSFAAAALLLSRLLKKP